MPGKDEACRKLQKPPKGINYQENSSYTSNVCKSKCIFGYFLLVIPYQLSVKFIVFIFCAKPIDSNSEQLTGGCMLLNRFKKQQLSYENYGFKDPVWDIEDLVSSFKRKKVNRYFLEHRGKFFPRETRKSLYLWLRI